LTVCLVCHCSGRAAAAAAAEALDAAAPALAGGAHVAGWGQQLSPTLSAILVVRCVCVCVCDVRQCAGAVPPHTSIASLCTAPQIMST
jgi:hypothetical protein